MTSTYANYMAYLCAGRGFDFICPNFDGAVQQQVLDKAKLK